MRHPARPRHAASDAPRSIGLCGFVTDRDIVVRGIAQGQGPKAEPVESVCTRQVVQAEPDQDVDSVINMMADKAIRRMPVVDGQRAVGILSIGDLAQAREQRSALADISAAPPLSTVARLA